MGRSRKKRAESDSGRKAFVKKKRAKLACEQKLYFKEELWRVKD